MEEKKTEDVKFCIFPEDEDEMYELLPEHIKKNIHDRDYLVIGAVSEAGEMLGITVTDILDGTDMAAYLKYVYVLPGDEKDDIMKKLLRKTVHAVSDSGFRYILVKSLYDEGGKPLYDITPYFSRFGAMEIEDESSLLCYQIRQVLEGRFPEVMSKASHKLPQISFHDELPVGAVKPFLKECREKGYSFDYYSYDRQYTGFIIDGNRITGAVFAEMASENLLSVRDVYVSEKLEGSYAAFAMVAAVLQKAADTMSENAVVIFRLKNKKQIENLKTVVGAPMSLTEEKECFYKIKADLFEKHLNVHKMQYQQNYSIEQIVTEKNTKLDMLQHGKADTDYIYSLLPDLSSCVPGNRINLYISGQK